MDTIPPSQVPPAHVVIQQVDERGNVSRLPWPMSALWVWEGSPRGGQVPRLRATLELPSGVSLESASGNGAEARAKGTRVELDIGGVSSSAGLRLKDATGERNLGLVIRAVEPGPLLLVHPSCAKEGLTIAKESDHPAKFLFVSAYCARGSGNRLDLYVSFSSDATWGEGTLELKNGEPGGEKEHSLLFSLEPPKAAGQTRVRGRFNVASTWGGSVDYVVLETPTVETVSSSPSRWSFSLGAGPTLIHYQESIASAPARLIDLNEIAFTGKVTTVYALIPDRLEMGANAFGNILAITHSPDDIPSTQFFGINWRIGYKFPRELWGMKFGVHAGYYFWGMLTRDQAYGITTLSGPQLFLTAAHSPGSGSRAWFAYGKLAPSLTDAGAFSLKNRELAGGGGYQLTSPQAKSLYYLTLDLSNASYDLNSDRNLIRYTTYTLGLQMPF